MRVECQILGCLDGKEIIIKHEEKVNPTSPTLVDDLQNVIDHFCDRVYVKCAGRSWHRHSTLTMIVWDDSNKHYGDVVDAQDLEFVSEVIKSIS